MNYIQPPTKEQIDYFTYLTAKFNQKMQMTFQEQNDYMQLKQIVIPYIENLKQQSQQPQQQVYPGQYSNPNYGQLQQPTYYGQPQQGTYYTQQQQYPNMDPMYTAQNVPSGPTHLVMNNPNMSPNAPTAVGGGGTRFSSENLKDNNIYGQQDLAEKNAAMMAASVAPVVVEKPLENLPKPTPNKGSEFKPLILVTQKCMKEVNGNKFEYVVHKRSPEEGEILEYSTHASIYANAINDGAASINTADVSDIKFIKEVGIFGSLAEAVSDTLMLNGNNEDESRFVATECIIYNSGPVRKETTDNTKTMYADIFKRATDLKTLAAEIKVKLTHKNDFTKNTFKMINERITNFVNVMFKGAISSDWSIESFSEDIDELYNLIEKEPNAVKTNNFYSLLIDIFHTLRTHTDDVYDWEDSEEADKVGLTIYTERVTMISTIIQEINYELLDLKLTSKGAMRYIDNSITPVLYNMISAVYDNKELNSKIMILLDKDGSIYRIIKSKISTFSIERIK